jgi:hypothetical protein
VTAGKHLVLRLFVLAVCLASPPAGAQDWYLLQGIFDAELYDTDTDSPLLSRNEGDLAALGRLQLWAALQLSPDLQFYVQGQVESDNFEGYGETTTDLDQVALRYTRQAAPSLYIEAGKILSPLAAYSERRLSTRNPLIGQPYLYTTGYPWGAKVVGSAGWFDYQAAWIDPSGSDPGYQRIEPDRAFRPALGAGVTPFTGLRCGLSWTQGPYLNDEIEHDLPYGSQWRDYTQRVVGLDFQYSRGYLELNGQLLRTNYEVPYRDSAPDDSSYYLELKYTWTPRLYGAVRYQGVEVSYVDYPENHYWYMATNEFRLLEVGLGYRFSRDLLFKVAYETDHWDDSGYRYAANARGHAVGLQLSWFFDLASLFAAEP